MKLLGDWTPAIENGIKVSVKYVLPINFKINNSLWKVFSSLHSLFSLSQLAFLKRILLIKMMNDIKNNLQFPNSQACISGRVYVNFIIDTLGQVSNVKIARGIREEFDKEAERVVKLLNNWKPGTIRGKKIAVKYTVPINFVVE